MKKITTLLLAIPGFYFAQLATPEGKIQVTTNPDTGNVGIGIANPQSKLDIAGGINIASAMPLQLNGNDTAHGLKYKRYNTDDSLLDGPFLYGWSGGTLGIKKFDREFNILSWRENGNVGIGVDHPQTRLDINGTVTISPESVIQIAGNQPFHGLQYFYKNFAKIFVDGPVLYGWSGGGLGIRKEIGDWLVLKWNAEGNVSISNKLEAKEIKVTNTPTADFVFEEDYLLPDLASVEQHIKEKKHLPEIASASEMEKEGVNIGDFQIKLLQKIEELTLYSIEQYKVNKQQSELLQKQIEINKALEQRLEKLEQR